MQVYRDCKLESEIGFENFEIATFNSNMLRKRVSQKPIVLGFSVRSLLESHMKSLSANTSRLSTEFLASPTPRNNHERDS
jgi:hypothetical protein